MRYVILFLTFSVFPAFAFGQNITKDAFTICSKLVDVKSQTPCLSQKVKEAYAMLKEEEEKAFKESKNFDEIIRFKEKNDTTMHVDGLGDSNKAFYAYLKKECKRTENLIKSGTRMPETYFYCQLKMIENRIKRLEQ